VDLKELRYFRAVAQFGTLSKAAAHLRIAQPALSRQMIKLEHSLGVKLLQRNARGVTLTRAGLALLDGAERVEQSIDDLRRQVTGFAQDISGLLRIGAQYPVSTMLLPNLLKEYRAKFPSVVLHPAEGYSGQMLDALLSERLDIAIVDPPSHPHAELLAIPLWTSPMRLVLPASAASDPEFQADFITIEALSRLPIIMPSRPHSLRAVVDQAFARRRLRFEPAMEAEGSLMIFEMVKAGLGYAIFPRAGYYPLEQAGELASREIRPTIRRTIGIVTRNALRGDPAVAEFISMAKEGARRLARTERFGPAALYLEDQDEMETIDVGQG